MNEWMNKWMDLWFLKPLVIGGIKVYKDHVRKDEMIIDVTIE